MGDGVLDSAELAVSDWQIIALVVLSVCVGGPIVLALFAAWTWCLLNFIMAGEFIGRRIWRGVWP